MSDLIRRRDVVKVICENCKLETDFDRYRACGICRYVEAINSIPSAERKGKWIEHRPPTNDYCGMVECPFCGEELVGEPTDFNYCPNCGAMMRGEHNGQ